MEPEKTREHKPPVVAQSPPDVEMTGGSTLNAGASATSQSGSQKPQQVPDEEISALIGTMVGEYKILDLLGTGGMGLVFRAKNTRLKRVVALKTVRSDMMTADMMSRFSSEAQAVCSLSHPHIVTMFDVVGKIDRPVAMALQFIEGAKELGKCRMSFASAIDVFIKLADALSYAHDRGRIHRDVKPSNVLLNSAGHPFITDFGLVRTVEPESGMSQPGGVTVTGSIIGTPRYMAPEQTGNSSDATALSDFYSLGVTFYRTLTGHDLFNAETTIKVLYAVSEEGSESRIRSGIPKLALRADLEAALIELLVKWTHINPAERFQNAGEVKEALKRLQGLLTADETVLVIPVSDGAISGESATLDYVDANDNSETEIGAFAISTNTKGHKSGSLRLIFTTLVLPCCVAVAFFVFRTDPSDPRKAENDTTEEVQEAPQTPPVEIVAAEDTPKPLVFDEDAKKAWEQFKEELDEHFESKFSDEELIIEDQELKLKLSGKKASEIDSFLKRLSGSKGKPPWQRAYFWFARGHKRSDAFKAWAKEHNVTLFD